MKESKIGLEDLLRDESFIRIVLGRSPIYQDQWNRYTEMHPEMTDLILQAREIITFISARHTQPKHPEISQKVFNRLQQQIQNEKQRNKSGGKVPFRVYWYAASVILLLAISLFYLLYRPTAAVTLSESKFLEVIVPEGQRSQLILPDGSRVWLNSGTQFKYPTNFLSASREVYLRGEAYFEVTHTQNNMPFTVYLKENLQINVLGTEFNVKSYESDKVIETTLVNGSIRMIRQGTDNQIAQVIDLKPNEKAVYRKEVQDLIISNLVPSADEKQELKAQTLVTHQGKLLDEIEVVTAWKNEELVFRNESFEDIAVRMERWFGMKITVNDESLRKERFTGKFVNNESIYQILDIFNRSESIQYSTKNKEITITKKKKNLNPL